MLCSAEACSLTLWAWAFAWIGSALPKLTVLILCGLSLCAPGCVSLYFSFSPSPPLGSNDWEKSSVGTLKGDFYFMDLIASDRLVFMDLKRWIWPMNLPPSAVNHACSTNCWKCGTGGVLSGIPSGSFREISSCYVIGGFTALLKHPENTHHPLPGGILQVQWLTTLVLR